MLGDAGWHGLFPCIFDWWRCIVPEKNFAVSAHKCDFPKTAEAVLGLVRLSSDLLLNFSPHFGMYCHSFHNSPQCCTAAVSPSRRRCVADYTHKLIVFELKRDATWLTWNTNSSVSVLLVANAELPWAVDDRVIASFVEVGTAIKYTTNDLM